MNGEKKLGIFSLTSLVTGNMIGSGIFLLPSAMARLGSMTLLSWVFTALGSLFLAFVFARLSTMIPKTGGPYAYAHAGLGNAIGFQTAFCYWVNAWIGNSAIVLAAVGYLTVFFPGAADPKIGCLIAIGLVWLFTWINIRGVHTAGIVQLVSTIMKLIPLLLIIGFGWFYFHVEYITDSLNVAVPPISGFDVITQGATLALWGFTGLESASVPADSVENPTRTIPIATILGTLIASACYILGSTVIMGMIPNEVLQNSSSPFATAAQMIFGDWGKWLIALGAVISMLGCLNGWILVQGQIPMAAADDHLFLKVFARRNKHGVPAYGLIISSILITILLLLTISPDLVKQYKLILLTATFTALISYLYTPVAEIVLLRGGGFPFSKRSICVAVVAVLYSFWAIIGTGTEVLSIGVLLVLASIPLYIFARKNFQNH
jgi:basic amino acid/polyamine antiporter, APA family